MAGAEKLISELVCGESAEIVKLDGDSAVSRRLMEMSLLPGERVTVLRTAPWGDPIMLKLSTSSVAIRRKDAARVFVRSLE